MLLERHHERAELIGRDGIGVLLGLGRGSGRSSATGGAASAAGAASGTISAGGIRIAASLLDQLGVGGGRGLGRRRAETTPIGGVLVTGFGIGGGIVFDVRAATGGWVGVFATGGG